MNRAALYLIVLVALAVQRVTDLFRRCRVPVDCDDPPVYLDD